MNVIKQNIKTVFPIYAKFCQPPDWILDMSIEELQTYMKTTTVYINSDYNDPNSPEIKELIHYREPVNIGMKRLYDIVVMKEQFGYSVSNYNETSPNIAVYTKTPVKLLKVYPSHPNEYEFEGDCHIINAIAPALDSDRQPDYIRLEKIESGVPRTAEYKKMLLSAFKKIEQCYLDLKTAGEVDGIVLHGIGTGAFSQYAKELGINVEQAFRECYEKTLKKHEENVILNYIRFIDHKYDKMTIGISDFIKDYDLSRMLIVNAWDPFSMAGNGNGFDESLDGHLGRISAISVLCWSHMM
jgi:hypothetical protein